MITLENTKVFGFEDAIRGMRNPKNSWDRSTSHGCMEFPPDCEKCEVNGKCGEYYICENDLKLMNSLAEGGPVHAKYRRMIMVYVDITAPLYWWKEFDTYKVGTVANSCSTMHKLTHKPFELSDFSYDHLMDDSFGIVNGYEYYPIEELKRTIKMLNLARERYLTACKTEEETGLSAKDIWWQMIQLLPSSYNQKRTVMMSYEVLSNMKHWRANHKLDEWVEFCKWINTLPYSEII